MGDNKEHLTVGEFSRRMDALETSFSRHLDRLEENFDRTTDRIERKVDNNTNRIVVLETTRTKTVKRTAALGTAFGTFAAMVFEAVKLFLGKS